MTDSFVIRERLVNEPLSPYSLQSELSTHLPSSPDLDGMTPDPSIKSEETDFPTTLAAEAAASEEAVDTSSLAPLIKSEETDSPAVSVAGLADLEETVDVRRRVEDHVHAPPLAPPSLNAIYDLAIESMTRISPCGLHPFNRYLETARSPSPENFGFLSGDGTAASPIRVDTPPPAGPNYVYPPPPDPDNSLTAEELGPIWAEVVEEEVVLRACRRIKVLFRSYFFILDGSALHHCRRSGGYRRLARRRLYESVMEELDAVLETVDEVQMTKIE
ncbi:hypothetical protein PGTUg99_027145 [Puccinia graminis f. sp. tritici]|uniref:Uncharacterized protein n=1 Tax=Puccinia graminis f. sp. tritici TaxID=56615 RepID=A0A5B0N434_PUCGR|nr:hypothetical protein PGTUg99_027145 [Puccinia graminis f. sp. tritici]